MLHRLAPPFLARTGGSDLRPASLSTEFDQSLGHESFSRASAY
jgi:hypothetical protein